MQIDELIPGINLENRNIEFKGIIEEGKDENGKNREIGWLKTVVAFANTDSGAIYVGVEDKSHKIVALEHTAADKIILMIHRQIQQRITPTISYDVAAIPVSNTSPLRYIIRIDVKKSKNLPVMLHENGLLGIYVRNFGRTEIATSDYIRDMILMSDSVPYDSAFTDMPYIETQFSEMKSCMALHGENLTAKVLISKGIISSDGFLSKGAALFADSCTNEVTKISASVWPGFTKGGEIVSASESFVGSLLGAIKFSVDFIRNHSNYGFRKEADGRSEYISYPLRSVTEGVVNAIGHRNYFIVGSQIEINLFKDRLEITSPGALLGVRQMEKEKNISAIMPRRRNEIICAMLELCRYMEEKGSGFDKIEDDYRGYGEEFKPFISSDDCSFTLTLPDLTYSGIASDKKMLPEVYAEKSLSGKNDLRILSFCYSEVKTAKEIADFLEITPSTYFRKNTIARLVKEELLTEMIGYKCNYYRTNGEYVKLR